MDKARIVLFVGSCPYNQCLLLHNSLSGTIVSLANWRGTSRQPQIPQTASGGKCEGISTSTCVSYGKGREGCRAAGTSLFRVKGRWLFTFCSSEFWLRVVLWVSAKI